MTIFKFAFFILLIFFLLPTNVSAANVGLPYGNGWYTNLCGDPSGINYDPAGNCRFGHCDPTQGYCDNSILASYCITCINTPVARFVCNGWLNECKGTDVIREDWGTRQEITFPDPGCDKTVQIYVFNKYCFIGNQWACTAEMPDGDLKSYMVWYSGPCPTPPSPPPSTPPQPNGPSIYSLQVVPVSPTQAGSFSGTSHLSGNQSNQQGQNWLNPLYMTLNASSGTNPIILYSVGFYEEALGYASSFDDLKTKTGNTSKGFLLAYGRIPGVPCPNPDSYNYCYYAQQGKDNWVEVFDVTNGTKVYNSSGQLVYTVYPGSNIQGGKIPRSWVIRWDQNFGSKSLFTAVYVKDSAGLEAFNANQTVVP